MAAISTETDRGPQRAEIAPTGLIVGRGQEGSLELEDRTLSRTHFRVYAVLGRYYLEDLDSSNGTRLNGKNVIRARLHDGDEIQAGAYRFRFEVGRGEHSESAAPVVNVKGVSREYELGENRFYALRNVSLQVAEGEFMALAGPSGSGKSTLLNLIGCIDSPTEGEVVIEGQSTHGSSAELADFRARTIGFIFQTFNLLPVLSAWENVEFPLLQRKELTRRARESRVNHYLDVVGLLDWASRRPNELSGGQRQRVAIARALVGRPRLVLADEPTANLDHKTGEAVLSLMKRINEEEGTTFIFSTHDPKVMEMADRVVRISDGEIVV